MSGWNHNGRTAAQRGYGAAWRKIRKLALQRDKHLCQYCRLEGRLTPATEVDHRLSKAKGGTDDLDNLASTCRPCHEAKTARENGQRLRPCIGEDGWPIA